MTEISEDQNDSPDKIDKRAASLVACMTFDEKIGLVHTKPGDALFYHQVGISHAFISDIYVSAVMKDDHIN